MKKITNHALFFILVFLVTGAPLFSQANIEKAQAASGAASAGFDLPLKRLSLFSSGVGFYEHSGRITSTRTSPFELKLPFSLGAVNDALKSLIINDPLSDSPAVRYPSSDTLYQTLKSLAVDLSGNPGIPEILNSLKGAELEAAAPTPIRGRIIGVENQNRGISPIGIESYEPCLSLFTPQGIRSIAIKDIASFSFTDEKINDDLNRALDLLMGSRDWETRELLVSLPGEGSRNVSISYVIPVPVWKVSYRLDLSLSEPMLQGWAIVDNDSDTDWNEVELSLVTGKPVSFIQNLYAPYRTSRPVVPLAIAGIAESRTYESGSYGMAEDSMVMYDKAVSASQARSSNMMYEMEAPMASPAPSLAGGTVQTAEAANAGEQFEFTLRKPVSLERHQSAMLPLIESSVKAEKTLVFSGSRAGIGRSINPAISAELTNTSGMKLPAGPITVYDDSTYAGDALIEFFPEDEKRIVSYGEDLSVSGTVSSSNSRMVSAVSISAGVMTISRRQDYEKTYALRNASSTVKKLIIEHPITQGASLGEPKNYDERTPSLYRFRLSLPPNQEINFTVREEMPLSERITLAQLRPETFLSYASNQEIPAAIRNALAGAVELKKKSDDAAAFQKNLEAQQQRLISEQERIRRNLEAAGNQSPQGQDYLKRLVSMDGEIDELGDRIDEAVKNAQAAGKAYDNYIGTLNL